MAHEVTLVNGDGVGPELADAARRCVDATGVDINWDIQEAGIDVMEKTGTPLPDSVMQSIKRTRCALKAPITTPVGTGFRSINVHLRQELGLFACVRPCKYYAGVRSFFSSVPVDLVIVRENTEDLYAGIEFEQGKPETAELIDYINKVSTDKKIRTGREETGVSIKPMSISGLRAHHPLRLRIRPRQRPQKGQRRTQGQHHEVQRRAVPGHRAESGRRVSRRASSSRTASSTTCACSWCRSPNYTT